MMKNRAFVFLSLLTLLAVSCQGPVTTFAKAAGTGRVTVATHTPGRTVVPLVIGANYTVTLTSHEDWDPISATIDESVVDFGQVPAGIWDVAVTAEYGDAVIGRGSLLDQVVTDGGNLQLTVPITTTQTGRGGFIFTFRYPVSTGVDTIETQLYSNADGSAYWAEPLFWGRQIIGDQCVVTVLEGDLPSGAYRLVLTFRRGGETGPVAAVETEAVNVFDNLFSDVWLNQWGSTETSRGYSSDDFSPYAAVTGVTLNKNTSTLVVGATEPLAATVGPSNAWNKAVTWSSSDESLATVDAEGVVTAVSTGLSLSPINVFITATTDDGAFTDTCTVTVMNQSPATVHFDWGTFQSFQFDGTAVSLAGSESLDLMLVEGTGTDWKWYVDGVRVSGQSLSTYNFAPLADGFYTVTVTAVHNGVLYSGSVNVTYSLIPATN